MKKPIGIYLLSLFTAVVLYACTCKEQGSFLKLQNLFLETHTSTEFEWRDSIFTRDTLYLDLGISTYCIAQSNATFDALLNPMKAFSKKCNCGASGFRNPVTQFKITTDSSYAGYTAGTDITHLFAAFTWYRDGNYLPVYTYYNSATFTETLSRSIGADNGQGWGNLNLFITQKPNDTQFHSFTFQLTTADTSLTISTKVFKWI